MKHLRLFLNVTERRGVGRVARVFLRFFILSIQSAYQTHCFPWTPLWCEIHQAAFSGQVRTGNVFSNSSSAYELINNSEEKRYDTDLYAIMIYQPHVHPCYISKIPAEGRWISATIKTAHFKATQLISCAYFVLIQPSIFRYSALCWKLLRCRKLFAFFQFTLTTLAIEILSKRHSYCLKFNPCCLWITNVFHLTLKFTAEL